MKVFVTVGTTSFDSLIKHITEVKTIQVLKERGFNNIVIQNGRGTEEPQTLSEQINTAANGIISNCYRYKDSLSEDVESADLVISHAGAGTCLEVLSAGKPLLVVINEELMNNHQIELAQKLAEEGYCEYCTCSTLAETLQKMSLTDLKEFEPGQPQKFASFIDNVMGVS